MYLVWNKQTKGLLWFVLERQLNGQCQQPGGINFRHDNSRIERWRENAYKDRNTQKTNAIHNMQFVSCVQYSKSCVQCTKIINRTVNCDVNRRIKATWCHYNKKRTTHLLYLQKSHISIAHHLISGEGSPLATHESETNFPGLKFWVSKVVTNSGGSKRPPSFNSPVAWADSCNKNNVKV